jgi:hypothetical protein
MLLCLLLAWGRFAPFYALLYQLPYFSTIRNPVKFIVFFSWALAIVFAFGLHGLSRRYLDVAARKPAGLQTQFKNWWAGVTDFDRNWTFGSVGVLCAGVVGWMIYAAEKPDLIAYLQKVGFGDTDPTHDNSRVRHRRVQPGAGGVVAGDLRRRPGIAAGDYLRLFQWPARQDRRRAAWRLPDI